MLQKSCSHPFPIIFSHVSSFSHQVPDVSTLFSMIFPSFSIIFPRFSHMFQGFPSIFPSFSSALLLCTAKLLPFPGYAAATDGRREGRRRGPRQRGEEPQRRGGRRGAAQGASGGGAPPVPRVVYSGCLWIFMDINGYFMDILWIFMDINGY